MTSREGAVQIDATNARIHNKRARLVQLPLKSINLKTQ